MKRNSMIAIVVSLIVLTTAAWAGPGHHMDKQAHLDRLAERLGLDDSQTGQVELILREQHERFRGLHKELQDQNIGRGSEEARALRREAHRETLARLGTVLSEEQLAEFEQMHSERLARRHEKRRRWRESEEL